MSLNLTPLSVSRVDGDSGHTAGHNATNTAINTVATYIDASLATTSDLSGKAAAVHTHAEADVTSLVSDLAGKQPLNTNLTAIAALTPANDDVVQRKGGVWTNRTVAQLKFDLGVAADIAALVASSPTTLDTLAELAAALGNDPNFATTIATSLGGKQPLDSDLTTIAGLTATTDSFLQAKAGAWAARTIAQVKTDLGVTALEAAGSVLAASTQASSYTLALADAGTVVESTSATGVSYTVPPNSSVAFPVGTVVELCQYGAGQITVVAGAGVTLRNPSSLTSRAQYSTLSLRKRATDEWVVAGDLT